MIIFLNKHGYIFQKDVDNNLFPRFLYSDEVQIGPETVMTTLYTAKKYAVPALEAHCVEFLKKNLRADNAFMLLTQVRLIHVCVMFPLPVPVVLIVLSVLRRDSLMSRSWPVCAWRTSTKTQETLWLRKDSQILISVMYHGFKSTVYRFTGLLLSQWQEWISIKIRGVRKKLSLRFIVFLSSMILDRCAIALFVL